MVSLAQQIIRDFEINTGESLAETHDEILILLRDENAVFPCVQVEKANRVKQYRITPEIVAEIRAKGLFYSITTDRPYQARLIDTYWLLIQGA